MKANKTNAELVREFLTAPNTAAGMIQKEKALDELNKRAPEAIDAWIKGGAEDETLAGFVKE